MKKMDDVGHQSAFSKRRKHLVPEVARTSFFIKETSALPCTSLELLNLQNFLLCPLLFQKAPHCLNFLIGSFGAFETGSPVTQLVLKHNI